MAAGVAYQIHLDRMSKKKKKQYQHTHTGRGRLIILSSAEKSIHFSKIKAHICAEVSPL